MDRARRLPGIVTLAASALTQTADLVQTEFRLARAEMSEKLSTLLASTGLLLVGGIFLAGALFMLLVAVAAFLIAREVPPAASFVIVAFGSAAVGLVLAFIGRGRLAQVDMAPKRTINQLELDASMAKEKVS